MAASDFPKSQVLNVPAEGGTPKTVVTFPGLLKDCSISVDGQKILCSVAEETSDVWLMENFDQ